MALNDIYKPQSGTDDLMSCKHLGNMGSLTQTTLETEFQVY